jgi:hypothetical protein
MMAKTTQNFMFGFNAGAGLVQSLFCGDHASDSDCALMYTCELLTRLRNLKSERTKRRARGSLDGFADAACRNIEDEFGRDHFTVSWTFTDTTGTLYLSIDDQMQVWLTGMLKPLIDEERVDYSDFCVGAGPHVQVLVNSRGVFYGDYSPYYHVMTYLGSRAPRMVLTDPQGYKIRAADLAAYLILHAGGREATASVVLDSAKEAGLGEVKLTT